MIRQRSVITSTLGHAILLLYLAIGITGDCPTPPVYTDRTHTNYDASYSTGDQATYECAPGYYRVSGQTISTCQSDESWSQATLQCQLGSCSNPGTPQHGTRSGDDFRIGQQVSYSCDEGYRLEGTTVSTCLVDSSWSSGATTCITITCPSPPAPPGGSINPVGEARFNDIVTVLCDTRGYMYSETPNTRRCQDDGTWTGTQGTCIETNCGLPTLYNGQVDAPVGTGYATEIRYQCNDGTTMDMSKALKNTGGYSTCYATGKWDPLPPTCNLHCGRDVPDVTDGSISHTGSTPYPHNTELKINCDAGFTRQGETHVRCTNGTWIPPGNLLCVLVPTPKSTTTPVPTVTPDTPTVTPTVTPPPSLDYTIPIVLITIPIVFIPFIFWISVAKYKRRELQNQGRKHDQRYRTDVHGEVKKSPMPEEIKRLYNEELANLISKCVLVNKAQNTDDVRGFVKALNDIETIREPEEETDLREVYIKMYELTIYDLTWVEEEYITQHMETREKKMVGGGRGNYEHVKRPQR